MRKYLVIVGGLIVLAIVFIALKPSSKNTQPATSTPATQGPVVKTFSITLKGDQSGTNLKFKANQGDQIVFKINSDRAEEFHLHGYDKAVDLEPGQTAELKLTADLAGNFVFELEHSATDLGSLEVQPKS